jgi:colicin import membrane protein
MSRESSSPTISLRERSIPLEGGQEKLPKWLFFSFLAHIALIISLFVMPLLPTHTSPAPPIYTVDLVGGERIGGYNLGTESAPAPTSKDAPKKANSEVAAPPPEPKKESKKEKPEKIAKSEKVNAKEKPVPTEEKVVVKQSVKTEQQKKDAMTETKSESKSESVSLDRVRERLMQSAIERVKARTEGAQKTSKGEVISAGPGEGHGSASLGVGGPGGGGVVKGIDFIQYRLRMENLIKDNWAWAGQKNTLKVVVGFGIKDSGDIFGIKIVQSSGDPSYDESVLRAIRKSSPLPVPPENYRKDFADVELTFRP